MEKGDKGSTMIRMGVSGWMFLLVPAYPGCPDQRPLNGRCHMTLAELMNKSDHNLFCKLCAPMHALNHLLPPAKNRASLRTRSHSYQLLEYCADLHKKFFFLSVVYIAVKWNTFWFFCFVLYVIVTFLFMFIIWCESVASSKYYIHTYWHSV